MKIFNKKTICVLGTALIATLSFNLMADASSVLNYLPKSCNIAGNVNFKDIKNIKAVKDTINQTENDPIYKSLKAAGLTADNINDITYGMFIKNISDKKPSFIALLQTEKKANVKQFVDEARAKDSNIQIGKTEINGKNVYEYVDNSGKNGTNEPVYCLEINDNLIALGTKDFIDKCANSNGNKADSIMSNSQVMNLIGSAPKDNMVWLAAVIPDGFNQIAKAVAGEQNQESKIPNIKDGILAFNYNNNTLTLSGQLNCATEQDVQKVMLPIQMVVGVFAMNPKSGIKPQDISLKPEGKKLDINISIPEKAINNIVKSQTKAMTGSAGAVAPTAAPSAPQSHKSL